MFLLIHKRVYPQGKKPAKSNWTFTGRPSMHGQNGSSCSSRQSGMTLLEVVIAMFVLVVLFGAALSGVVSVNRLTVAAKNRTRAVAVLNQKMEEMRAITFANLNAKMTATPPASSSAPATFTGGYLFSTDLVGKNNNYAFHWTRELQTTGDDVGASLIKVKVTVEWAAGQHKIAISSFSYFSQFGVSPRA